MTLRIPDTKQCIYAAHNTPGMTWEKALGELIDNSFDANASKVWVTFAKSHGHLVVTICDNGDGCDDLSKMQQIGGRQDHDTTISGRYGVGSKDVWSWTFARVHIASATNVSLATANVDLADLWRSGVWDYQDPYQIPLTDSHREKLGLKEETGCVIKMTLVDHKIPGIRNRPVPSVPKLAKDLGRMFTPALKCGRSITIEDQRFKNSSRDTVYKVEPYQFPTLVQTVETTFLCDGYELSLKAGIVGEGEDNELSGIGIHHAHRSLPERICPDGCPASRISGVVSLPAEFPVYRNKDGLSEHMEELRECVTQEMSGIIELLEEEATQFESDIGDTLLDDTLSKGPFGSLKKQRESRDSGESSGTASPSDSGRKRRKSSKSTDNPGSVDSFKGGKGMKVEFGRGGDAIQVVDSSRIILNENVPFFATLKNLKMESPHVYANITYLIASQWKLIHMMCLPEDNRQKLLQFGMERVDWDGAIELFDSILEPATNLIGRLSELSLSNGDHS